MDYKEKYEMALEGIQEILSSGEDSIKMSRLQLRLQGIFPELKESEGEKVKRILLSISSKMSSHLRDIFTEEEFQCFDAWSYAWLKKQGEQKSAWSEEDEDILNTIINHFKVDIECTDEDDMVRWLKSLKDRVQPQREWNEEDKEQLDRALYMMEQLDMTKSWNDVYNWLKSLRPQNRWKPSDEQMAVLKEAVDEHFDIDGGALWHLYEDLKKLKE